MCFFGGVVYIVLMGHEKRCFRLRAVGIGHGFDEHLNRTYSVPSWSHIHTAVTSRLDVAFIFWSVASCAESMRVIPLVFGEP